MSALYKEKGAALRIDILREPEVEGFIQTHADILDSTFAKAEMSDSMRENLQRSDYIFSGFKTFHEINESYSLLLDENGNKKSFNQFLNDVKKIDQNYNERYLRAEYNFASASSDMAAKWEKFAQDEDEYYLQYRTANDGAVRPEHAALHDVTLPASDSFWDSYYPPNGWNCRCTVVQVLRYMHEATPHNEAMRRGAKALSKDKKGMFNFNPGKQQKTFPDYNPYTIRDCRNCERANGKFAWRPNRQFCRVCTLIQQCYREEQQNNSENMTKVSVAEKQRIYNLPKEQQFEEIYNRETNRVFRHLLVDKQAMDYERVSTAATLYAQYYKTDVYMMSEIHYSEQSARNLLGYPSGRTNPDIKIKNGLWIDVKSPFSLSNLVTNANQANRQGAIACITDDHCKIDRLGIEQLSRRVFADAHYLADEIHFIIDGVLYVCCR